LLGYVVRIYVFIFSISISAAKEISPVTELSAVPVSLLNIVRKVKVVPLHFTKALG
jgi:hypothetical protein